MRTAKVHSGWATDFGVGVLLADAGDAVAGEIDVHVAVALPEVHRAAGFFHDPGAEVLVGHEEDVAIGPGALDDLDARCRWCR